MKIAYRHLVENIHEKPSIDEISDRLFQLGHEHEIENHVFNMEFTPNRGDCLSIKGLLRDLAVFYKINLAQDIHTKKIDPLSLDFENLSPDVCPKITFLKLEIDEVPKEYNQLLSNYFKDLGINKNNFFADVSNYISYETGQPTHCFDATKITNKIIFQELDLHNNKFETLLDKKITLSKKNAVFSMNNSIISLAGVVGGKSTSCDIDTKTVLIECAYFQPEAIIGKSVKYDIQSEASYKFERGVDPDCHEKVLRRLIKIVSDHANIKDMSIVSYSADIDYEHKIPIDLDKINKIIGINITQNNYENILLKLGFSIESGSINVPSFRSDIRTNNDLAEEVARVIGYNNIKLSDIDIPKNQNNSSNDIAEKLRYFLIDNGFYEVINSPFVSYKSEAAIDALKVDNPLDSSREYLRKNLTQSLLKNLLFNEKRQKDSVKLFEIADIYYSNNNIINKKKKLSIIASGRVGLNFEEFSKKIDKKYFVKLFQKIMPNQAIDIKIIPRDSLDTKIKSEIVSLEMDIDEFPNDVLSYSVIAKPPKDFVQFEPISEQPSSVKDISYSIKDFSKMSELNDFLMNYKNEIIKNVFIFDYFKNEKSDEVKIGYRFTFQAKKTTLTAEEIDEVYNDIIRKSLSIEGLTIPGI